MSSEEDFDATPEVRRTAGNGQTVRPYMFEPLARPSTINTDNSDIDSNGESDSSDDRGCWPSAGDEHPTPDRQSVVQAADSQGNSESPNSNLEWFVAVL